MLAKNCRFEPSCSQYALEAIKKFGLLRGFLYTILRLLRCQPFSKYGYDPVPEKTNLTNSNHKRLAASSTSATSALTNSTLNKESS